MFWFRLKARFEVALQAKLRRRQRAITYFWARQGAKVLLLLVVLWLWPFPNQTRTLVWPKHDRHQIKMFSSGLGAQVLRRAPHLLQLRPRCLWFQLSQSTGKHPPPFSPLSAGSSPNPYLPGKRWPNQISSLSHRRFSTYRLVTNIGYCDYFPFVPR